jgi:hypothetical protein
MFIDYCRELMMKVLRTISTYLDELGVKRIKSESALPSTPRIGIFWLQVKDGHPSIFFSTPITLEFGQDYGDFLVSPADHWNLWEQLKSKGIVPKKSEYDDIPRGRVAYIKPEQKYKVFTGKWINPSYKSVISAEFRLAPPTTVWDTDLHYNGYKRLVP